MTFVKLCLCTNCNWIVRWASAYLSVDSDDFNFSQTLQIHVRLADTSLRVKQAAWKYRLQLGHCCWAPTAFVVLQQFQHILFRLLYNLWKKNVQKRTKPIESIIKSHEITKKSAHNIAWHWCTNNLRLVSQCLLAPNWQTHATDRIFWIL